MSSLRWRIKRKLRELSSIPYRMEVNSRLLGKLNINQILSSGRIDSIQKAEFKVFSQGGEDGIIQYIINTISIENKSFIEFGVQYYTESNTRFLLMNNDWKGLVIDGGKEYIDYIRHDESVHLMHDLIAQHKFITTENINQIFQEAGFAGDIGLMSIDVDGIDYWLWDAVRVVKPRIVICEYNSIFGPEKAITVPYSPDFNRRKAHYSDLYFGASLPALCILAAKKGYDFVGCTSEGVNAFFVRKDVAHQLPKLTAREGYVMSHNRESRDQEGNYSYLGGDDRLIVMKGLPVFDVSSNTVGTL
jgi:hypothetical protein